MVRWTRSFVMVLALAGASAAVAGCSSSGSSTSATTAGASAPTSAGGAATTSAPSSGAASVTIKNFSFSPTPVTVKVGQAVTVTNNDTTDHTFTDGGGAFDTGHIAPGTSKTVTLTKPGTYHYHCNIHPSMTGEIDVS